MKKVLVGFVAVVAIGCGASDSQIGALEQGISAGTYDTNGTHSNVGAMMVELDGYGVVPFCSGTLIAERVFLTAGHCTYAWDYYSAIGFATNIYVSFGFDPYNNMLAVESVNTPPDYGHDMADSKDFGVIVLQDAVAGITPATMPTLGFLNDLKKNKQLRDGVTFTVVGYGATVTFPPPDFYYEDRRQYTESKYIGLLKAQLLMQQNLAAGNAGTCYGDSGGPAFWKNDDGSLVLVGITSWGDMGCIATGFDYRVDVAPTLDFVAAVSP